MELVTKLLDVGLLAEGQSVLDGALKGGLRGAVIGGIIGGVVCLAAWAMKKAKKTPDDKTPPAGD